MCQLFDSGEGGLIRAKRAALAVERNFTGELVWSSAPEVSPGDLALLYRRSLSKVTVQMMVEGTGMPVETADAIRRKGIGSDIVALWQVTSGNLGPLHEWQASCQVRHLATIAPPIALKELKGTKPLRKWQDLRGKKPASKSTCK